MAKQMYENKKVIKLCGSLNKTEDGKYIVTVEGKDSVEEFDFNEILDASCEEIICFSVEEEL